MAHQNEVARDQDFTFIRTPAQVGGFVDKGLLVPVEGNADYRVATFVSFPFARPEVLTFVERLAAQYRASCGEPLVVTSLTRPQATQPTNAHALSVHPAGMAVDLRISQTGACRSWLEATLVSLEAEGVLDATRERNPPHYHVAVFPDAYRAYVERLVADSAGPAEIRAEALPAATVPRTAASVNVPPTAENRSSGSPSGRLFLAAFALAPLGLALGLRRGPPPDDEDSATSAE
jgi:hypothetical protein